MKYTPSEQRLIKRFEKKFVDEWGQINDETIFDAEKIYPFLIKEVRRTRRSAARLGLVPKDLG